MVGIRKGIIVARVAGVFLALLGLGGTILFLVNPPVPKSGSRRTALDEPTPSQVAAAVRPAGGGRTAVAATRATLPAWRS
jgi:hypothetical protein